MYHAYLFAAARGVNETQMKETKASGPGETLVFLDQTPAKIVSLAGGKLRGAIFQELRPLLRSREGATGARADVASHVASHDAPRTGRCRAARRAAARSPA